MVRRLRSITAGHCGLAYYSRATQRKSVSICDDDDFWDEINTNQLLLQ